MLKNILGLGIIVGLLSVAQVAGAQGKTVYVDMQKAVQVTQAGKKAKEQLDAEFQKRKTKLDKKKTDIETMGKDLDKKRSLMSEEALQKKQIEIQDEMMKFQKEVGENQLEIQKKEEELVKPIIEKMKKTIEKLAQEKSYAMVLENKNLVIYGEKGSDITDEVVSAFEKAK